MTVSNRFFGASLAVLSMGAAASTSVAQAQPARTPQASAAVEEVLVTARRREESAQSVPVSVSAYGSEQLEQRSVTSLEDLTRITPGLRYAAEGGAQNTTISLRGLSKVPIGDGTPAVVTYFADVPLASSGSNLPTFDLTSIQVLKGPQGTLFGRNTIGGAVLVTPRAPDFDFGGYVSASLGEYDARSLEGALNVPLIDEKLALRIAGQVRKRDGFTKSLSAAPDMDDLDQYSLRGTLRFEPTDRLRTSLMADYFKADEAPYASIQFRAVPGGLALLGGGNPLLAQFDPSLAANFAAQQARGIRRANTDATGQINKRKLWGITSRTEFDLSSDITLRNILGYRKSQTVYHSDADGGPALTAPGINLAPLLGTPFPVVVDRLVMLNPGAISDLKQLSEELQLVGTSFDNRLTWILGAYYEKAEPNGPQGSFFEQFNLIASTTPIGPISLSPPAGGVAHTTSKSTAVFGQIGLDLSSWAVEGLKLNVGYRYTWDEVDVCGGNIAGGGATTTTQAPLLDLKSCQARAAVSAVDGIGVASTKTQAPTWTLGLDYQVTPDLFAYIVTRRGYRQGGVNTPLFESPCTTGRVCVAPTGEAGADLRRFQFIGSEQVTDVEAGLKSNWTIGEARGLLNVSVFSMKYKDAVQFINVTGVIPATDPAFPTRGSFGVNAADLTIRGAELEASISPVRSLTLTTTGSYIDQTVDEVANLPRPFSLTAAQVTLPTPEWSATFQFRWTLPFRPLDGELTLGGDHFWTDDYAAQGSPIPGYSVTNFRLDWNDVGGRPLKASVFVTNAFDKEYVLSPVVVLPGFPFSAAMFGPPRMFGVELTYRFGE